MSNIENFPKTNLEQPSNPQESKRNLREVKNPNELMRLLSHAIRQVEPQELFQLFDDGMNINQESLEGPTALQLYSARGEKAIVEELLRRGANVNHIFMYQDRLPKTALDAAIESKKADIIEVLKEHGAKMGKDLDLPDKEESRSSWWDK